MPERTYESLPEDAQEHYYDEGGWMESNYAWKYMSNLVRAESMAVGNDPRFFCGNVLDKRLAAFKVLTIVNSLMFGTALSQCFALKKDFNFHKVQPMVGCIAIWQIVSFTLAVSIAIMCLLSLYIIAHQLFYTFRLMTAGPSGFDQAAIFYLTRSITMWRHLSIKFLFNGLVMFLFLVSIQLMVKFYKDADHAKNNFDEIVIMNVENGQSVADAIVHFDVHHKLNMTYHVIMGYAVLGVCIITAIGMIYIRRQHLSVFNENYMYCSSKTQNITDILRDMSHRAGMYVDT
jgi:hypothetical protein